VLASLNASAEEGCEAIVAITLRLGLAGLLIAILCLCMFVFTDIVSGSPLVAFGAIAGASTGILMVLYFDARKG
jgi:presenilin-like A22 family membrane protease